MPQKCAVLIRGYLSINCKVSPSYLRAARYEVFLGGYSTFKNNHVPFMYTR